MHGKAAVQVLRHLLNKLGSSAKPRYSRERTSQCVLMAAAAEHTRSALFAHAMAVLGLTSLESILGLAVTLRKCI